MNDNDKAILKDAAFRLEEIASQLQNLSGEAMKELEESKNRDAHGEIEHIEALAADLITVYRNLRAYSFALGYNAERERSWGKRAEKRTI